MCIYDTPEQSYAAFKIIWAKWYKGMPNYRKASRYSQDRANDWLRNVTAFYYSI